VRSEIYTRLVFVSREYSYEGIVGHTRTAILTKLLLTLTKSSSSCNTGATIILWNEGYKGGRETILQGNR